MENYGRDGLFQEADQTDQDNDDAESVGMSGADEISRLYFACYETVL